MPMELVSLGFFAQIFNLKEENLSWGFAFTPYKHPQLVIAIIVKNKNFYVDITKQKLIRIRKRGENKVTLFPATLKQKGNNFQLLCSIEGKRYEISFTKTDIKNIYATRCDLSEL